MKLVILILKEVLETADLSVAGIMGWLTGQKHKQAHGNKPTITVHFDHEWHKRNPNHTVCYPLVGACGRDLTLPVAHMQTKEQFEEIFFYRILHGAGSCQTMIIY